MGLGRGVKAGRPPQSITIRLGARVTLRDGDAPLEHGTVTGIERGQPRDLLLAMDDGRTVRLLVG